MAEMTKNWPTQESSGTSVPVRVVPTREQSEAGQSQSPSGEVSGRQVASEAKDVASNVAGQAKELVATQVSRRAERSAGDIGQVAQALRRTRGELHGNMAAPYVEKAAEQLERFSQYLRTASADDVVHKTESFARREPLLFLGGAFALGILGARFLKSSARHGEPAMSSEGGHGGYRVAEQGRIGYEGARYGGGAQGSQSQSGHEGARSGAASQGGQSQSAAAYEGAQYPAPSQGSQVQSRTGYEGSRTSGGAGRS